MLKSKIFSKKTKADQLLPRDILKDSRMFSGVEAEKQINEAIKPVVKNPTQSISPINLISGDSLKLNDLLLHADGSVIITGVTRTVRPDNRTTETTVTYITYG